MRKLSNLHSLPWSSVANRKFCPHLRALCPGPRAWIRGRQVGGIYVQYLLSPYIVLTICLRRCFNKLWAGHSAAIQLMEASAEMPVKRIMYRNNIQLSTESSSLGETTWHKSERHISDRNSLPMVRNYTVASVSPSG